MKNKPPLSTEVPPELMTMGGSLVFTKDGEWFHDGVPFTHDKVRDYFSRHLVYSTAHKGYVVEDRGRCVAVTVEDTAVVVRTILTTSQPWVALLSGAIEEELVADTLEVSAEGVFYCLVRNRSEPARLLRPAWQALLPFLSEGENGTFLLRYGDPDHGSAKSYVIRSR